jgi:hypothetical protein
VALDDDTKGDSAAARESEHARLVRHALFGVLVRDVRHEAANLVGLVTAWSSFLARPSSGSSDDQVSRAASAVERLSRLERATQHCAEGLRGDELRTMPAAEVAMFLSELMQSCLAVRGIKLSVDTPREELLVRGPVGELTIALAGVVRSAAADARSVSVFLDGGPTTVRIVVKSERGDSAASFRPAGAEAPVSRPIRPLGVEMPYAASIAKAFGGRIEGPAAKDAFWEMALALPRHVLPPKS